MAAKTIDPRRDIWGALIAEAKVTTSSLGSRDKHFLFVGSEKCGKSSLQNGFFGRLEEPAPTLALGYQSCTLHTGDGECTLHFWELGGGKQLEKIIDTLATPETQSNFVIFVCFDLTRYNTMVEATEWLPIVMRKFKKGYLNAFLVGTHYDGFESKDPSFKADILNGFRTLGYQYGTGVLTYSSKIDSLISRFKTLIKSIVITDVKRPEKVMTHTLPLLVYKGEDDEAGGSTSKFFNLINTEAQNERERKAQETGMSANQIDPSKEPIFAEEDIDKFVQSKERDLEDRLRALRSNITD